MDLGTYCFVLWIGKQEPYGPRAVGFLHVAIYGLAIIEEGLYEGGLASKFGTLWP